MLQDTTTLSTIEAKYMVASEAVKEVIWLRGLIGELGLRQEEMIIYCDSLESAIHLANNQVYHSRTKHIGVRYHFIREAVAEREIMLEQIHTNDSPADMMTKLVTIAWTW